MSGVRPRGQITVMYTDDELYRRFRGGDTSAYDELMIRLGDSLILYLNGYLHNWHDSEDLMIEAFARIMVKKPLIGDGKFRSYLYRTARNLASRFHARSIRAEVFSLDGFEEQLPDQKQIEEKLQKEETKKILQLCMEGIDSQTREALWLVYVEDMSYAQAAMVMGVSTKKIDHLLDSGKKRLRTELEKEGVSHAHE